MMKVKVALVAVMMNVACSAMEWGEPALTPEQGFDRCARAIGNVLRILNIPPPMPHGDVYGRQVHTSANYADLTAARLALNGLKQTWEYQTLRGGPRTTLRRLGQNAIIGKLERVIARNLPTEQPAAVHLRQGAPVGRSEPPPLQREPFIAVCLKYLDLIGRGLGAPIVKGDVVTYNHVALKYQARERLKGVRIQNPDDSQMNKAMDYILEVMSWKRAADAAIQ